MLSLWNILFIINRADCWWWRWAFSQSIRVIHTSNEHLELQWADCPEYGNFTESRQTALISLVHFFFFFLASPTEISTQMKIMKARSHHGASTDALMQFNNSTQEQTMTAALGSTDVWSSGKTNEWISFRMPVMRQEGNTSMFTQWGLFSNLNSKKNKKHQKTENKQRKKSNYYSVQFGIEPTYVCILE